MEVTISKTALVSAISVVSKALATNSTLPILGGIHLSAHDGELTLMTTDMERSIRHTVQANVEDDGETVVSGKILGGIAKALPDAAVSISTEGTSATIKCGRSRYRLNTLDPRDFPEFPRLDAETTVELPSELVQDMTAKVVRATSKDDSRPILKGVKVDVADGTISLVATDSYRLAVAQSSISMTDPFSAVIPGAALKDVLAMPSMTETLSVGVTSSQVVFEFGQTTFVTRRIEGNYPDFRRLMPQVHTHEVRMASEDLSLTLKRASAIASKNPTVKMAIVGDSMVVSAYAQDLGEFQDEVQVSADGGDVEIALNYHFVSDGIDVAGDEVIVEMNDSTQPAVFRSYGTVNTTYLCMPVRF